MKAIALPRLLVVACLVACPGWPAARADDLRPSWECLPDDTVAMVRLPRPAGFLETLRSRTKFGAVVLGPDRVRKAWDLAVEAWGGADDEPGSLQAMEERLAKYGLGTADMEAAFAGDMGVALVMRQREGGLPPLGMALAWMEPGAESAERMVAAFQRMLEEQADDDNPPQRVDVEMAGHPVTWVTVPILKADLGEVKVEGDLDAERLQELRAELAERAKLAPKVVVGKMNMFVARVGGRMLAAQTLPPPPASMQVGIGGLGNVQMNVAPQGPAAADEDPDRVGGTEEARGIFERYLAAHAAGDAGPLADVFQAAGARATLPAGTPLVEAVLDPRPLLATDDEESARRMKTAGLADLGPAALRLAFDDGRLRQGIHLALPAPRAGLFRILEQDCDAADVPSFVTSEAVDFTQISLDLAQAYRTIKEFGTAEWGDQATNLFATVEAQAQAALGIDVEAMLANLGSRHWIVSYPPQVAAALREARRNREGDGEGAPATADRLAVVWKLADDAPVQALLPKLAGAAQAQVVEEQGFQGFRLPAGIAIFVGQGHLVVGMGGDALEKTLSGIRNPPAGAASLRESDVPRKAAELVTLGPARMFSLGDATRTGGMLGQLCELVAAMEPEDVDDDEERDLLQTLRTLVPSAEEMRGVLGVGASSLRVDDAGIAVQSAWEMPAP